MSETRIALIIVIVLSVLSVLADVLIKRAADKNQMLSLDFVLGATIYGLSGFGWFYALRSLKLATLGGVYALSTLVLVVISGIVFFREKLSLLEYGIVAMAVVCIFILWQRI